MPKLIILGTSNAVPDVDHENTHMAVIGEERSLMIDCVNNPIVRLRQAGLPVNALTDLVLTHFHPDHVSGVPSLLMNSWLMGRHDPLNVYGLAHTLDRIERLMEDYEWQAWPNFFPVHFKRQPETELEPVFESREMRVFSSPVRHLIPTIGLRIEFPQSGRAIAYSCDTEPCPEVARLAAGVDVLIHEATGATRGHSSAAQAGMMAREANAKQLVLIHYRTGDNYDTRPLISEARKNYTGEVTLASDFMEFDL